jgi:hypothetical protein
MRRSGQFDEQRLGVLQVSGVEALGEPTIYGGEQIAGLAPLALLGPQPGETGRRAQLPRFRALRPGDVESLAEPGLGSGSAIRSTLLEQ